MITHGSVDVPCRLFRRASSSAVILSLLDPGIFAVAVGLEVLQAEVAIVVMPVHAIHGGLGGGCARVDEFGGYMSALELFSVVKRLHVSLWCFNGLSTLAHSFEEPEAGNDINWVWFSCNSAFCKQAFKHVLVTVCYAASF